MQSSTHPGIRQLQLILLKVALILGIEIHVNVEFRGLVEPPEDQENERECTNKEGKGLEGVRKIRPREETTGVSDSFQSWLKGFSVCIVCVFGGTLT